MDTLKFAAAEVNYIFKLLNVGGMMVYAKNYLKYRKVICENTKFKNIHAGKTCFILGNGPSLRDLDVDKIIGQDIFTVNAMVVSDLFNVITPKYHCITDYLVYEKYKDKVLEKVSTTSTDFFFNRRVYAELGQYSNTHYTCNMKIPTGADLSLDIDKNASTFVNVIPYAIMIAIYMGYKRIVLLGCDFSFFASRKDAHFYEIGKFVKREETLFQDLFGSAIACREHYYLSEYSEKHGITIINATPNSLLDAYRQEEL